MRRHKINRNRVRKYARRMEGYVIGATSADIETAAQWYEDAMVVAMDVAGRLGVPLEHGAAIVSAFSPRVHWSRNVTLAIDYASGREVGCLGSSILAANRAQAYGIDALNGEKTNQFARAIAGDEGAVVVDVWIARAAGLDRDAPTTVQYREISSAIRSLARKHNITPRTMQALIWIMVRGSAH
jgi:hypothetical protein